MNNNFKKFLPSRKVAAFVVVPVFCVILYMIITNSVIQNKQSLTQAQVRLENSINNSIKEKDTDGDGLLDWQERLHGTDENNPDTDTDGVSDGQEIKVGTNPLDPFNKESKERLVKVKEDTVNMVESELNLTSTEKLARDLFGKVLSAKQTNFSGGESTFELMAEEIYINNTDIFSTKRILTKKDLKIDKKVTLNTFKKKFNQVINKVKNSKTYPDLESAYLYIVENDIKGKENLEQNLHVYIGLQNKLKDLVLPNDEEFIKIYLNYLNSFFLVIEFVEQSIDYQKDPIKVLAFLQSFDKIKEIAELNTKLVFDYLK